MSDHLSKADLKDLNAAIKALERMAARNGDAWHDDFKFDPIAACLNRMIEVRQEAKEQ